MAWFGENLKSFTDSLSGQLQTAATSAAGFTREVLAEGTEETSDHETEHKIAEDKIKRLELVVSGLQAENERLRELTNESEEKAETSELQINRISLQYRAVVQEREDEIKRLKQSQNDLENYHPSLMSGTLASSTSTSSLTSSMVLVPGEDHDIGDVISAQQEINRLSNEVLQLQNECSHWKSLANTNAGASFEMGGETIENVDNIRLSARVKELEKRLQKGIDESQHELTALQNAHSHKVLSMKKAHATKEEEYKRCIQSLEEKLPSSENHPNSQFQELSLDSLENTKKSILPNLRELHKELERTKEELSDIELAKRDLEADIKTLKLKDRQNSKVVNNLTEKVTRVSKEKLKMVEENRVLQESNKDLVQKADCASKIEDVKKLQEILKDRDDEIERLQISNEQVRSELLATRRRLLASVEDGFKNTSSMLEEVQNARKKYSSDSNSQKVHLFLEKQRMVEQMIDIGQQLTKGKLSVAALEAEGEKVQSETEEIISRMGEPAQKFTDSSLEEENSILKEAISHLEKEVIKLKHSLVAEKQHFKEAISKVHKGTLSRGPASSSSSLSLTDATLDNSSEGSSRSQEGKLEGSSDTSSEVDSGRMPGTSMLSSEFGLDAKAALRAMGESSDVVSFDGEYDDSMIFSNIKERFPEAASVLKDQMEQMELIRNDWEMEKQALEEAVIKMREQLREKEKDLKDAMNMSTSSDPKQILDLEKKITDLKEQLQAVESAKAETEQKLQDVIKDKGILEKESSQLKSKAEKLVVKVKQTLKERDNIREQFEESKQSFLLLQDELNSTRHELDEKNASMLDVSMNNDRLNSELDSQHEQALQQVLKTKEELMKKVEALNGESEVLKNKVKADDEDLNQMKEINLKLKEEVARLIKQMEEKDDDHHSLENERISGLEKQVADLETAKESLIESEKLALNRNEELLVEMSHAKAAFKQQRQITEVQQQGGDDQSSTLSHESGKLTEELVQLKEALEEETQKRSELEVSLAKLQHEKISLREDSGRKTSEINTLKEGFAAKEARVEHLEMVLAQVETAKALLEEEVDALQGKLKDHLLKHEQAVYELSESKDVNSSLLGEEQDKHKKSIKEKESELSELRSKCEELEFDLSGTKDILSTTLENQQQLTEVLKEKESDIKHLASENAFFVQALDDEKRKAEGLKKDHAYLEEMHEQLEHLQKQKEMLTSRIEEFESVEHSEPEGTNGRTLGLITDLEQEIGTLREINSQKDLQIKEMERKLVDIEKEMLGSSETFMLKENELETLLTVKDEAMDKLQSESNQRISELTQKMDQITNLRAQEGERSQEFEQRLQEKEGELTQLTDTVTKLESEIHKKKEEVVVMKKRLAEKEGLVLAWKEKGEELQSEVDIYDESLKVLQEKTSSLETKTKDLKQELEGKESKINQLLSDQDSLNKTLSEKTGKNEQLQSEVDNLRHHVQSEDNHILPSEGVINCLSSSKVNEADRITVGDSNISQVQSRSEFSDPEPLAISDSEKQLEKMVQEREKELNTAKEEIQSLLKKLDDKSKSIMGNTILVDLHKLQMQKKNFESERHQMVTILNEKTRECSSLKNEVHRMMKIITAEKLALEKAQEDNRELQKALQSPRKDMQKEALQNLSRLIQDKDLEISALKQKNDSLLEVLQASAPNQSSDISNMLKENEKYQKDNKILKEERDQLVVSIHQKHHESVAYYEEVQRLAGVLTAESERSIQLQKLNETLTTDVETKDKSLIDLQSQLQEKGELYEEIKNECEIQKQSFADLELQYTDLNESFNMLEKRKEETEEKESGVRTGISEVELNKKDEEIKHLKTELDSLRAGLKVTMQEPLLKASVLQQEEGALISDDDLQNDLENKSVVNDAEVNQIISQKEKDLHEVKKLREELEKMQLAMSEQDELINQKTNKALQKESEVATLRQQIDIQNQGLLEQDAMIQQRTNQLRTTQEVAESKEKEVLSLKNQLLTTTPQLHNLQREIESIKQENQTMQHNIMNKDAETRSLQDMSNRLAMQVKEKDFEMEALREKNQTLTSIVHKREMGTQGEVERMLRETEAMQRQAQLFQHERDQAVLALQKNHGDMEALQSQINTFKEREQKLNRELERLRSHLLQVEESYMAEVLQAEDREKILRDKLAQNEDSLRDSSTAVQTANHEASRQIENLLDQLSSISNEKEEVLVQLAATQEQANQYATSLSNLQMVLEQFQKEKDFSIFQEIELYQKRAEEKEKIAEHLFRQKMEIQEKLSDTQDALDSARRLADQLDKKEDFIGKLKDEIGKRDSELHEYRKRFEEVSSAAETKVDKPLVKNLFINYFHAPEAKKNEVIHLIGSVLNFSDEDLARVGIGGQGGWLSGWFGRRSRSTPPSTPGHSSLEQSFTQQFVHFLELESTPQPSIRLPLEEMTKERPKSPAFNPFSAPLPSQSPFIPASPPVNKSVPTNSSSQLFFNPVPVSNIKPAVTSAGHVVTPSPILGAAALTTLSVTALPAKGGGPPSVKGSGPPSAKGSIRDVLK